MAALAQPADRGHREGPSSAAAVAAAEQARPQAAAARPAMFAQMPEDFVPDLRWLAETAKALVQVEAARDWVVAGVLARGATWADVGHALGVSRQAAHRRFRHLAAVTEAG